MDERKLFNIKKSLEGSLKNQHCGFIEGVGDVYAVSEETIKDILELLKKQTKTKVVFGRTKDGEFVTECGNCGTHLDKAYSNCPKCKKELDWNSNQT